MERWAGRVALVTGASAGIGAALVKKLARDGMKVVGCARNEDKIQSIADELKKEGVKGSVMAIKCDVKNEDEIMSVFSKIKSSLGGVDVCINSAGLGHNAPLLTGEPQQWRELLEVNVLALCIFTKEAVKSMRERNVDDGHIIQLSSMSGHRYTDKSEHMYAGTKHAVKALTEGVRRELREINSHIRITSISPGNVNTEFVERMYSYDPALQAKMVKPDITPLEVQDIVDAAIYALSAPPRVQVHDILMRPTEQVQ